MFSFGQGRRIKIQISRPVLGLPMDVNARVILHRVRRKGYVRKIYVYAINTSGASDRKL